MKNHFPHTLIEKINNLRSNAMATYDLCIAQKVHPEHITPILEPLTKKLDELINLAALAGDFDGCAYAIKTLERERKCHEDTIAFLNQKILDSETYIHKIKKSLISVMKETDSTVMLDNGYAITLIEKEEKFDVVVR